MNKNFIQLSDLPIGKTGKVKNLTTEGLLRRRMLDLGIINNTLIEALQPSPCGDPIAYLIRGAVISLRSEVASTIFVETL